MSNGNIENSLPANIYIEAASYGHIQGVTFDTERKYIYVSFTTCLCKFDINGKMIGSVIGLLGHLGCIDFDDESGKVFGSLEYKHDSIGKGIAKVTGKALADEDAFYMAVFDVDKIDREDMDAEKDGVMKAAYLPCVVEDYSYVSESGIKHRYGCSGIDGTAIGREFGQRRHAEQKLYVAYGIYSDKTRSDNNCQVLLQYSPRDIENAAKPLSQKAPHKSGLRCEKKCFVYTGNTTYGIQNLEYDFFLGNYYAAVYVGEKEEFPNYSMFIIDGAKAPEKAEIPGCNGESGYMLTLKEQGLYHGESGIYGYRFPYGDTGMYSLGNGQFYFSMPKDTVKTEKGRIFATNLGLYKYTERADGPFEKVLK